MKKYNRQPLLLVLFLFFGALPMFASHVPGGNITYECLGNNQYKVILTLYEDCGTSFISSSNETVDVVSDCGQSLSLSLNNTVFQQNISQLCPSSMAQSECNGGSLPGVYMHQWEGVITLPNQCSMWRFEFDDCCRNSSSNLSGSSNDYYFYATLDNTVSPCNSSPTISAPPIPYYCVNQPVCYNLGIVETDGDSLVYSLVEAREDINTTVNYQTGYSGAQPINGITIDPATGLINFIPTSQGNFVVVIMVEEYLNGQLVGSIIQDFTFEIANCSNQIISCNNSSISNVNGSVTQVNSTTLEMCEGVPFSFDLTFTDPDVNDSIFVISNIGTVLQGSVVNIFYTNPPSTNVITMNVSWTPPPGSSNNNNAFTVTVRDNACPVSGQQTLVYNINVVGSTYAGMDRTICLGDSVAITAQNGSVFNWNSLSGDPIQVGTNISCSNCQSTIAFPTQTTVYEVVSDLSGNCVNRDTITVNVAPNFTYSLTQTSSSACLQAEIQLEATPTPAGNYTYSWSPPTGLSSTSISNPVFTSSTPGVFDVAVEITSDLGCVKYDTINLNIIPQYAPDVTLSTLDSVMQCNEDFIVDVDLGGGIPAVCAGSAIAPTAPTMQATIGTFDGENTGTSYPAPFANYYKNAKHQFLYKASELQAMGLVGGVITELAFEVTDMNNATSTFNDYTIKMKCTGVNDLSTWESGLTTVFSPQNINVSVGWNILSFTTGYDWDGTSNIIVEVCYNNLSTPYTRNASTPYENTSFTSTIYYKSDANPACPHTSSQTTSTKRPLTKFGMISSTPNPANYTFVWTGGTPMTQNTSPTNFITTPATTGDYQVVVTNIAGGCADSATIHVEVECLLPNPIIYPSTCNGGSDARIDVTAIGNDGPPWQIDLMDASGNLLTSETGVMDTAHFNNLLAGQYLIRITDTLGLTADTLVTVTEPTPFVFTVSNDTILCIGGSVNLSGNVTGGNGVNSYTYNWGTGITATTSSVIHTPQSDTVYNVFVLDSLGCSTDTLDISVSLFPPILTTTDITDTVCPNASASISASANGGHGGVYSYAWFDESGASIGVGSTISVTPTSAPSIYYVEVTDDCETPMKRDSVVVFWYDEPVVNFDADKYDGCYPVLVNFNNLTPVNQVNSLVWSFGDGTTAINNSNPVHIYNIPGSYDVNLSVTNSHGCTHDTTIAGFITVYDYPIAQFSTFPDPATIFESEVTFTNESSSDVVDYQWFFRDSTLIGTSNEENPVFEFSSQAPFIYPVELVVTNQDGCTDTATYDVIVNGVYSFYVPTAFTPNNDGLNDFFDPKGEGIENTEYTLTVFDRDGHIVFSTTSFGDKWDGKSMGKDLPENIYVWRIETKDRFTGEEHEYFGHVVLIR